MRLHIFFYVLLLIRVALTLLALTSLAMIDNLFYYFIRELCPEIHLVPIILPLTHGARLRRLHNNVAVPEQLVVHVTV